MPFWILDSNREWLPFSIYERYFGVENNELEIESS